MSIHDPRLQAFADAPLETPQPGGRVLHVESRHSAVSKTQGLDTDLEINWPGKAGSLLDRMDYLTSIFPFHIIKIQEREIGSGDSGAWRLSLRYWGPVSDHAHMLRNFTKLVVPPKTAS